MGFFFHIKNANKIITVLMLTLPHGLEPIVKEAKNLHVF